MFYLQSQDKLSENERLKEEQQRLLRRIDKLQRLTGITAESEHDGRSPEDVGYHRRFEVENAFLWSNKVKSLVLPCV